MKPETGRLLRRLGLMIEMLGLAWLMVVKRGMIAPANLEGTDPVLAAKIALAVGFGIWIVGNFIMYWPRKSPSAPKRKDEAT